MNPHQILGVPQGASREQIKKAFHTLAHKHHPDKGGDPEVFKKISAAYSLVKDAPSSPSVEEYDPQPEHPSDFADTVFWQTQNMYRGTWKEQADNMRAQQEAQTAALKKIMDMMYGTGSSSIKMQVKIVDKDGNTRFEWL